jgi:tRNA(Phe) wybutosine-synthesizing methylase Tyw3
MISKQQFDELVENTTRYLQEHNLRMGKLERQLEEINERLTHMENRKRPGPKPRSEAA